MNNHCTYDDKPYLTELCIDTISKKTAQPHQIVYVCKKEKDGDLEITHLEPCRLTIACLKLVDIDSTKLIARVHQC